jgi:hypothetical protein
MGPVRDLGVLYRRANVRLERLRELAVTALPMPFSERDRRLCYVSIEALNTWSEFVRSYILSCVNNPQRVNRAQVTHSNGALRSHGDVLHAAVRLMKGAQKPAPKRRRDEPAWHDIQTLLKTCAVLGCSHIADVQNAVSIGTKTFDHLPTLRNYYAHRNHESKRKACQLAVKYAIARVPHPTLLLSTPLPRRPQPLIADWIDDLRSVAQMLCE